MNSELLLSALDEYLISHKDLSTGNIDLREFQLAKKRFSRTLEQYIEQKVLDSHYSSARKRDTSEFVGVIESVAEVMKSSYDALLVLHTAPPPPSNLTEWLDGGNKREWMAQYKKWYEEKILYSKHNPIIGTASESKK